MMDPIRVFAFRLTDGQPIFRIPYTAVSGTETLNAGGDMKIEVAWSRDAARLNLRKTLYPWLVGMAAVRGDRVLHAGPVTARGWDPEGRKLTFTAGGGWDLFDKRLVLNRALAASWRDGEVLIDEDNPAPDWQLTFTGTYTDIGSGLIAEALRWGSFPVDLPDPDGGLYTRTYLGWDMALVSDRLTDLTKLEHADELEFQPYRDAQHRFRWRFRGAPELMDVDWQWNTMAPAQRIRFTGVDDDGSAMATQAFGLGGRADDLVLAAKVESTALTGAGWPVLQSANTSHSTVSELDTLQSWVAEDIARGSCTQESFTFAVGMEYPVHPGDWAEIKVDDLYLGRTTLPLKIVQVGWDTSEWQTVSCRLRGED